MLKFSSAAIVLSLSIVSLSIVPASSQGTAISPAQSIANAPGTAPQAAPRVPVQATKPMTGSKVERTAKSKDCSMEADKQGLHGKARKTFRSKCKAGKV